MADLSVGKPYVDRKLGAILSAALLNGRRSNDWYVYLVFDRRQRLRYVGQTGTLFSRLSQHKAASRLGEPDRQQSDDWADVMALCCQGQIRVKAYERKLIHRFHPPDNRKCETPGCRYYLDRLASILATRAAVNKDLRTRGIQVGQS